MSGDRNCRSTSYYQLTRHLLYELANVILRNGFARFNMLTVNTDPSSGIFEGGQPERTSNSMLFVDGNRWLACSTDLQGYWAWHGHVTS